MASDPFSGDIVKLEARATAGGVEWPTIELSSPLTPPPRQLQSARLSGGPQ